MYAEARGFVAMCDDTVDLLLICRCCDCRSILRALKGFNKPNALTWSHFGAVVDGGKCVGCMICAEACPTAAIEVAKERNDRVDYAR